MLAHLSRSLSSTLEPLGRVANFPHSLECPCRFESKPNIIRIGGNR
jgi:hypothetical protein